MTSSKESDEVLAEHGLPPELRRAWPVHRAEDPRPTLMVSGVVDNKDRDEVIPPHLRRENLVVTAYPFRTASLPRRTNH
jgi:hypothetical protein